MLAHIARTWSCFLDLHALLEPSGIKFVIRVFSSVFIFPSPFGISVHIVVVSLL